MAVAPSNERARRPRSRPQIPEALRHAAALLKRAIDDTRESCWASHRSATTAASGTLVYLSADFQLRVQTRDRCTEPLVEVKRDVHASAFMAPRGTDDGGFSPRMRRHCRSIDVDGGPH